MGGGRQGPATNRRHDGDSGVREIRDSISLTLLHEYIQFQCEVLGQWRPRVSHSPHGALQSKADPKVGHRHRLWE